MKWILILISLVFLVNCHSRVTPTPQPYKNLVKDSYGHLAVTFFYNDRDELEIPYVLNCMCDSDGSCLLLTCSPERGVEWTSYEKPASFEVCDMKYLLKYRDELNSIIMYKHAIK